MELSLASFEISIKISTLFVGERARSHLREEKVQMGVGRWELFPRLDSDIAQLKPIQLPTALLIIMFLLGR